MEPKLLTFFIFCVFFCGFSFETAAKGVTCGFGVKNVKFSLSISYDDYTCNIKSFDLRGSDSKTVVEGVHETDKTDNDVKIVECWRCVTAVPILDINFCQKFENLEMIILNHIKIEQIDPQTFQNCQNLKYLALGWNKIQEIPENLLAELPKLIHLSFYENQISSIAPNAFKNQRELQELYLSKNKISSLPPEIFKPLINLKELWLGWNQLTIIHSDSFGVHRQLTVASFYDSKIVAIDEKFIEKTAVDKLDMTGNVCFGREIKSRSEMKEKMQKCFDNYQPRMIPVPNNYSAKPTENPINCGRRKSVTGTIIGGSRISHGDYPWIAALEDNNGDFFGGGILVSNKKVVTAAHCIQDKKERKRRLPRDFFVILGMHDLDKKNEVEKVVKAIFNIHMHPAWNPNGDRYDADIAVIVLESYVPFSNYIQPICLIPDKSSAAASINRGVVVGYGKSENETITHERTPKIIDVPIQDSADCFRTFSILGEISSRRTFCAGTGSGIGICNGDSGGGLVIKHQGVFYLRGIVSASLIDINRQCDVNAYAIYTDVLNFNKWIDNIDPDEAYEARK